MVVSDHNLGEHLVVKYTWYKPPNGIWKWPAGWYVVRNCKCHRGLPVTVPLASRARAEHVREMLIKASEELGT